MAVNEKINYPTVKNYIVQFTHQLKPSMMILAYNVDNKFQFVDLQTGMIGMLVFNNVEDAEDWLYKASEVLAVDKICTTYVP